MKLGLFLVLLVLCASANIDAQRTKKKPIRTDPLPTEDGTTDGTDDKTKKVTVTTNDDSDPVKTTVQVGTKGRGGSTIDIERERESDKSLESQSASTKQKSSSTVIKTSDSSSDSSSSDTRVKVKLNDASGESEREESASSKKNSAKSANREEARSESSLEHEESSRKENSRERERERIRGTDSRGQDKIVVSKVAGDGSKDKITVTKGEAEESNAENKLDREEARKSDKIVISKSDRAESSSENKLDREESASKDKVTVVKVDKEGSGKGNVEVEIDAGTKKPIKESGDVEDKKSETIPMEDEKTTPIVEVTAATGLMKSVHVSGNIVLVKHLSNVVGAVDYDLDTAGVNKVDHLVSEARLPFAQDYLARASRVTLYVATSKTTDSKLAFARFPIKSRADHFPLSFDIDVELPRQQFGLLERADITLYFFVYVENVETRVTTFVPAGTSQILLQGTNRLVQKLDVYVRASGIEIIGLFRGRFNEKFIRPGTSFQVFIVSEEQLKMRHLTSFESVAQLTINNVPAMYPVPFSLLVHNQMLKDSTQYYAIAFIYENGVRRIINQEPILVINDQKILVTTTAIVFNVLPSPFILRGSVVRSMPGSFFLQPGSSLIIRLHEIGSNSRDIIYRLPEILTLPQAFQINISQAIRFDPSKTYDIRALITDGKNGIYMASLQPIPLLDVFTQLTIPVDDLLHYVQVRLHTSSNQVLNYISGSTAQVFVTESPETPTKPIVSLRIDSITSDFREFSLQVPTTAIQRGRNYYLVMMIEVRGIITHVSKTLLISNNQPPPLILQLPVLSLNLISGVIYEPTARKGQWSSSAHALLYLIDDQPESADKTIIQVWKIHLENDFPVRFEVHVDFTRLRPNHVYRLQAAIENGRGMIEYKPADSVLAFKPNEGFLSDVRVAVQNVKTYQLVKGLVYINDITGPLPEKGEIIIQISSTPSLTNPKIRETLSIPVEGRTLPIEFTMKLSLDRFDFNQVYYFLVRYVVRDTVIVPESQAFGFSIRNEATVVLTLSKTPQVPITGQVTSTGSPLSLPKGSVLHLYITDNIDPRKPTIYSEVFLQATSNSLYEFRMNLDSILLQRGLVLFLRADILYDNKIILSIPRPALLQITPGGEWNINLVVDLPTLLIGQIVSLTQTDSIKGEFDVYIQLFDRTTSQIVHTSRLRVPTVFPQPYVIQVDNELFARYQSLETRAVIKNCREQTIFESAGNLTVHNGLNVKMDLPVVLNDPKKLSEIETTVSNFASVYAGKWHLSVTGVNTELKNSMLLIRENTGVSKGKVSIVGRESESNMALNKESSISSSKESQESNMSSSKESNMSSNKESNIGLSKEASSDLNRESNNGLDRESSIGVNKESSLNSNKESSSSSNKESKESNMSSNKESTVGLNKESSSDLNRESNNGLDRESSIGLNKESSLNSNKESSASSNKESKESNANSSKESTVGLNKESSSDLNRESNNGSDRESSIGLNKESSLNSNKESSSSSSKESKESNASSSKESNSSSNKESITGRAKEIVVEGDRDVDLKIKGKGKGKDIDVTVHES